MIRGPVHFNVGWPTFVAGWCLRGIHSVAHPRVYEATKNEPGQRVFAMTSEAKEEDLYRFDQDDVSVGTVDVIELENSADEWTGPRCEKCDAPVQCERMAVCKQCGWYASLGTYVEIDQEWEEVTSESPESGERPKPSHLEVWMHLLPWYAWLIIGSVGVVFAESLAVRLLLAKSPIRTHWSLWQLAIGSVVFAVCHIVHYLALASNDSDTGLIDFIVRPLKIWVYAACGLPKKLWLFDLGITCLAAALMSILVIGGIPYEKMLDWGFEKRPEPNLMKEMMKNAKHIPSKEMTMEEAIEELAGDAGVDDLGIGDELGGEEEEKEEEEPKERQEKNCVILGFRADEDGTLRSLVLASEQNGRLGYAGTLAPKFEDEPRRKLAQLLRSIRAKHPILPVKLEATWVRPILVCRISYTERAPDGRLYDMEFVEFLGKINYRRKKEEQQGTNGRRPARKKTR